MSAEASAGFGNMEAQGGPGQKPDPSDRRVNGRRGLGERAREGL